MTPGKPIKIRSLEVRFQGLEKVDIPAGKTRYTSSNEMVNTGLRLLESTTVGAEEKKFAFQFQLPAEALPSYIGDYASITWMLKARMDIPWSQDLNDKGYLRVLTIHAETPSPIIIENSEAKPRLRLDLPSNIFEPGDIINGSLTLLEASDFRSVRVQIMLTEESTAHGMIMENSKVQRRSVTVTSLIRREDLPLNTTVPFQLPIPQQAPSDYRGAISTIAYYVEAIIDIPRMEDIHLYARILVGLKPKPPTTTIMPQLVTERSQSGPEQAPPMTIAVAPGSTVTASRGQESGPKLDSSLPDTDPNMDPETTIIQILGDGGSKDLIEISTELQMRNKGFFDLNHVKKACEDLVSQGRLRRTAEGEYFAKYALNAPTSQQAVEN